MEKIGYVLAEAPAYVLLIWSSVRLVQLRRWWKNQPIVSAEDHNLLHSRPLIATNSPQFYLRLAGAVLAVAAIGFLEILVLGPFGAAILSGALLLTSASLVRAILRFEP